METKIPGQRDEDNSLRSPANLPKSQEGNSLGCEKMETKIPGQRDTDKKFEEPCKPARLKARGRQPAGQALPMKNHLHKVFCQDIGLKAKNLGALHACRNVIVPNWGRQQFKITK